MTVTNKVPHQRVSCRKKQRGPVRNGKKGLSSEFHEISSEFRTTWSRKTRTVRTPYGAFIGTNHTGAEGGFAPLHFSLRSLVRIIRERRGASPPYTFPFGHIYSSPLRYSNFVLSSFAAQKINCRWRCMYQRKGNAFYGNLET